MSDRYVDTNVALLSVQWATEVEVMCPNCSGAGLISAWPDWTAAFLCRHCGYDARQKRGTWHGPVLAEGRRPCSSCGYQWVVAQKRFENGGKISSDVTTAKCPNCAADNEVTVKFSTDQPDDHSLDPFFGFELKLQENTRYGTVWVYNAEHLAQLKRYICAKLRQGGDSNCSYFSRLPGWIKSAKNRPLVLKAIEKLEKRLDGTTQSVTAKMQGAQIIEVDGVLYRWVARTDQVSGPDIMVVVELADNPGTVLCMNVFWGRCDEWTDKTCSPVTPERTATSIRAALSQGWRPKQTSAAFYTMYVTE